METSRNTTLPPTQIKDFLVNEYFYKSNSFETLRFYLPLKICLNAFEKTHFFSPGLKLYERIQPIALDKLDFRTLLLHTDSHTGICTWKDWTGVCYV